MRRAYILLLLTLAPLPFLFVSCQAAPDYWQEAKTGQKKILVSFPPLYAITHAVAGEDAYVLCMLTTQGPHAYDGGPTDLLKVKHADLFIYNGLTLDDGFADKMRRNHTNRSLVVFNVGEVLEKKHHDLMIHVHHEEHKHGKDGKDDDHKGHKHGDHDPHVWLGPEQARAMTTLIAAKLGEIDPANAKNYNARRDKFMAELTKIEEEGKEAFKGKKNKNIVTMHEAFAYFAKSFDIEIVDTIHKTPGADPDAAAMAHLVKTCVKKNVAVIATEPQYQEAQAKALQTTLKRDHKIFDVEVIPLDPLETAKVAKGGKFNPDPGYYLKGMRDNIQRLAKILP